MALNLSLNSLGGGCGEVVKLAASAISARVSLALRTSFWAAVSVVVAEEDVVHAENAPVWLSSF